jgi:hypothetical protein
MADGGGIADDGCWAGGNRAGGGGIPAIVASSVHFARKLPLFRK